MTSPSPIDEDRIKRVYSAVGLGRELRTPNFLLALMAACAESAGIDPDTGEHLTWRQVAASITGSLYVAKQRAQAAEQRNAELEAGLKPFAEACPKYAPGYGVADDAPAYTHVTMRGLTYGDFRQARALLTTPEPEGAAS